MSTAASDDRFQRHATASVAVLFVVMGALVALLMVVGAQRAEPPVYPPDVTGK